MRGRLCIVFALLLAALPWRGAHAHAVLLESSPAANAVLARAPERVVLRFNEPVRPAVIRLVRASDQGSVELGSPEVTDTDLRAPLPVGLSDGSYVLSYRVTSADGHPVIGSFVFAIGAPGASPPPELAAAGASEDFWIAAGVAARTLWYGSLLLAAGLALFLGLLPVPTDLQPPLRRALAWLAAVALAACLALLGVTGGALYGGLPGDLLRPEPWRIALASPVAASVAVAAPGLGILILAARRARRMRLALPAGALLVAASFAASGHAATAGPAWITLPALMLHALCAAYWVGAFAPLLLALRRLPSDEVLVLMRAFSAGAVVAVACLLLAGVMLAALQVRTPAALITTDYGRLLLIKLSLVALLLGLGALNRLVLTPALENRAAAAVGLRRTIGADLALAAGVVVLTAGLGTVPPPRALAEQAAAQGHPGHGDAGHGDAGHGPHDYAVHAAAQGRNLVLVATPATIGENRIDLYLTDGRGQPVGAEAAELSFALPELGIEPLRADAAAVEPGHFRARVDLPLAGDWQAQADLLVDDFTKLPFRARIVIRR
jgi:copper transport protein